LRLELDNASWAIHTAYSKFFPADIQPGKSGKTTLAAGTSVLMNAIYGFIIFGDSRKKTVNNKGIVHPLMPLIHGQNVQPLPSLPASSGTLALEKKESWISRLVTWGKYDFLPLFAVGSNTPPLCGG
jgi:hypothetical protein